MGAVRGGQEWQEWRERERSWGERVKARVETRGEGQGEAAAVDSVVPAPPRCWRVTDRIGAPDLNFLSILRTSWFRAGKNARAARASTANRMHARPNQKLGESS